MLAAFCEILRRFYVRFKGENKVKGRIFRLGRLEQICQQKESSYRQKKLKVKGNGSLRNSWKRQERIQSAGRKVESHSLWIWREKNDFFKKYMNFSWCESHIILPILKWTTQWWLVQPQCCAPIASNSKALLLHPKKILGPLVVTLFSLPPQPLGSH